MYLLLKAGGYFGALITIGAVMFTAVVGVALLRRQGLATLTRGQQKLAAGQLPASEMAEGLLLAVAGPLLLTPGFITDAAGFALLIPAVRSAFAVGVASRFQVVGAGSMGAGFGSQSPFGDPNLGSEASADPGAPPNSGPYAGPGPRPGSGPNAGAGDIIDGEFERRD